MDASLPRPRSDQLAALAPLAGFSDGRLAELAQVAVVERARRGSDPLQDRLAGSQSVFLLAGELMLAFEGGGTLVVVGGSDEARLALNRQSQRVARSKAITDVDLVMLDDEVLDILATWDQVAAGADSTLTGQAAAADARIVSGAFGLGKLRSGAFAQLPVAHIDELLKRFERVKTAPGETVIREGDQGDYYFVVESGRFSVERLVGGAKVLLAELKSGDAFGEEALVSEAKRNATVTSLGEGELLRLGRTHFDELLREPLLRRAVARRALSLGIPVRQAARSDQRAARRSAQHVRGARPLQGIRRVLPERAAQRRGGLPLRAARLQGLAARGRPAKCAKKRINPRKS